MGEHNKTIELDGSHGEGGGQILRTALTLSMITETPFRIERIRARRSKPGLLRQHLTAVRAAAAVCGAEVDGAELGSLRLEFRPGRVRGGDYAFAIGSAGSCTLVLQTVLPALWFADGESVFRITGGTHNPGAPTADFLIRAWLPLMRRLGVTMDLELVRHGFYPAGGGEMLARVRPVSALRGVTLMARAALPKARATAILAGVPFNVAQRELATLTEELAPVLASCAGETRELPARDGPGNALLLEIHGGEVNELFSALGERGLAAERVASRLADEVRAFLESGAPVGEHLADQLVLPLALAGGGSFVAAAASSHLRTNIAVVERFLPVHGAVTEAGRGFRVALLER